MDFLVVGASWFLTSALLSTWANTTFLKTFNDPLLHTLIRFVGSAILGSAYLLITGEVKLKEIVTVVKKTIVPAVLLWLANYFNSISLNLAGITLTYVVKACIPVFTVVICSLSGQKFPILIYVSLIPICVGVALASGSDLDFSVMGLLAAFVSSFAQTLMNITIKKVRNETKYSGLKSFMGMTIVSSVVTAMVIIGQFVQLNVGQISIPQSVVILQTVMTDLSSGNSWPFALVLLASLAYHLEYMLNFIFVGYVNSVMFSVADIVRRIAIIVVGAVVFNKVLTGRNWVGIVTTLSGVLWYSYLDNKYSSTSTATTNTTSAAHLSGAATNPVEGVSVGAAAKKTKGKRKD